MSRDDRTPPPDPGQDPVEEYLAAYVDAVDRGEEPPPLDRLDDDTRSEVTNLLALLAGTAPLPGDSTSAADREDDATGTGAATTGRAERSARRDRAAATGSADATSGDRAASSGGGRRGTDAADVADDASATSDRGPGRGGGMRPRAESGFALAHGFIRPAPDVVVMGAAVSQAREAAGLAAADVVDEMRRRGATIEVADVESLEEGRAAPVPPREARLLAAVLALPLSGIEASAERWPSGRRALATIRSAGVDAVVLGEDVVVRTVRGDHLGVLRCPGDADLLDSRTYREAAAALLTGPWSYLAGALLVAEKPPHLALAVDALDCVTRWHAPTGLLGFSRLSEPEPLADAVASYDRTYAVHWTDPTPLDGLPGSPAGEAATSGSGGEAARDRGLAARIDGITERLSHEARRSRQPGKRPGYQAAARWLGTRRPQEVAALLDSLADLPSGAAQTRLAEEVIQT